MKTVNDRITFETLNNLTTRLRMISLKEFSQQKYGSYRISNNDLIELLGVDNFWKLLYERYANFEFVEDDVDMDLMDKYYDHFIQDLNVFCLGCGIYVIRVFEDIAVANVGLVSHFRKTPVEIISSVIDEIK